MLQALTLVAASGASSNKLHFEASSPSMAGRGKAEAILPSGEKRAGRQNCPEMTVSTKEEAFHRVNAALERAKDQILSGIPERDHVDAMRGVIELIEEHNEDQVKYILGKMFGNDTIIRKSESNSG